MTEPTSPSTQPRFRLRLTEGVALFLAPVVAVLCTFAYEAGYLGWYGVPYWIVRLDVTHVLIMATGVAVGLSVVYNYLRYVPIIRPWRVLIALALIPLLSLFVGIATAYVIRWATGWRLLLQLAWICFWTALGAILFYRYLVRPILDYKDIKSWEERWKKKAIEVFSDIQDFTLQDTINSKVNKLFGPAFSTAVVLFLVVLLGLYFWGYYRAGDERIRFLVRLPEPCLAVRRYADGLVCVDVDTTTWKLRPSFRILPFVDYKGDISAIRTTQLQQAVVPRRDSLP